MYDDTTSSQLPTTPEPRKRGFFHLGLALLLAVATFFSGLHIGSFVAPESVQTASIFSLFAASPESNEVLPGTTDLTEFWTVWNLMERKFALASSSEGVSEEERIRGAIQGLVRSYEDPYSVYLPPKDAEYFEEDISGNFSGVGMEVGIRNSVVTIIAPLPDTPAEKAGLAAGDVIVAIDETSTEEMSIDEAVRLIRGEEGTDVVLTIYREGETEFLDITVTRAQIAIPTIETEQRGDVFIIALYSFNARAEQEVQNALREFMRSDAEKLIFDLRGNPGGFLTGAVSVASFFLPTGKVVVSEKFGEGVDEHVYRSSGKMVKKFTPQTMVVLVDRGSASASEIVAGALSQHDVATLIGETTFGKGSVQELVDLQSGASLKVTIARWLTPNGTSISEGGLAPDIAIERTVEQRQNDEDPQLETAIDFLNGNYVPIVNEDVVSYFE